MSNKNRICDVPYLAYFFNEHNQLIGQRNFPNQYLIFFNGFIDEIDVIVTFFSP